MSQAIEIESRFSSDKSVAITTAFLTSTEAVVLFDGYQLIPGIVKARQEGEERVITSPSGRERRERILVATEERLWLEIYPRFPEKLFCRSLHERFDLNESSQGCTVKRRMTISYRPGMRLVAIIFARQMRRAIEDNNQKLTEQLHRLPEQETWA